MAPEGNFLRDQEEYLSTIDNSTTRSMVASILKQCRPYEEKYNTPLFMMNTEMLQDIFNHCFGEKLSSSNDARRTLEKYFKWQSDKINIPYNGAIDSVIVDTVEKVRKSLVSSPYHLARVMDDIFHPIHKKTQHNAYRSMLWLVYMGFTFAEAIEITFDEVDFEDMVVTHGSKRIEIYREAFEVMKQTKKATHFIVDVRRKSLKPRQMQDNLFLCGIGKSKMSASTVSNMLALAQEGKESEITVKSIEYSGVFYRTFEIERVTRKVDFIEAARLENSLVYDPDNPSAFKRKLREINVKYKNDYEVWKRAFF